MSSKKITEIVSIKNELGHFTFGYYPGGCPVTGEQPDFAVKASKSWQNPQDPIVYQLEVAPEDTEQAIKWAVSKLVEL